MGNYLGEEEKTKKKEVVSNYRVFWNLDGVEQDENYGVVLPNRCLHQIFLFSAPESLPSIFATCRLFYRVGNSNYFWKELCYSCETDPSKNWESFERFCRDASQKKKVNFKKVFCLKYYWDFFVKGNILRNLRNMPQLRKEWDEENKNPRHRFHNSLAHWSKPNQFDFLYKILFVGECGVGRSVYLEKLSSGKFIYNYPSTIGVDFRLFAVEYDKRVFKLQVWDTAGQERFEAIVQSYYRGAHGFILFFDLTKKNSLKNIKHWIDGIDKVVGREKVQLFLTGLKLDLHTKRDVDASEIAEILIYGKMSVNDYCEISSITDENFFVPIDRMFQKVLDRHYRQIE